MRAGATVSTLPAGKGGGKDRYETRCKLSIPVSRKRGATDRGFLSSVSQPLPLWVQNTKRAHVGRATRRPFARATDGVSSGQRTLRARVQTEDGPGPII